MSTRVFLSGGEVDRFRECMVAMKSRSILMTYFDLQKHPDKLKRFKDKYPDIDVITDSGAFTFFTKGWEKPIGYYRNYVKRYSEFLEKNSPYIHAAAELDIDTIVGDIAREWRENIFEKLDRQVLPIIFVWHDRMTPEDWGNYCKKYGYVGIGSDFKDQNYHKHMNIARQYLAKVHAFGYTRSTEIQQYDFYSVDSSTWLLGSKFGESDFFNGKTILRFDNTKKAMRQRYRVKLQNAGLSWDKIQKEEYYEVIKMNMLAFIEMEEYLSRANKMRAYWTKKLPPPGKVKRLSETEIDAALLTHGYSEQELKDLEPGDKANRTMIYSALQNGRLEEVSDWMKGNPDDVPIVFGEDLAAKVMDKSNPSQMELDALRKAYNLTLLKVQEALKRTSDEDFTPVIEIKRREPQEDPPEDAQEQGFPEAGEAESPERDWDTLYFRK